MDLFTLTPSGKLNDVDYTFNTTRDVTLGPDNLRGALGDIIKCDYNFANTHKKASTNLYGGEYQFVRTRSGSTNALVVGGPVFWYDRDNFIVTPDTDGTAEFAGVALNIPATKGNCVLIVVAGDVDALFKATATTKATTVKNDLAVTSIASSAATLDVLADATAVTWGTASDAIARLQTPSTAGALSRVSLLSNAVVRAYKEGVR